MPDSALPSHLVTGFRRFRSTRFASEHERYRQMAEEGQSPSTMVIACSDSRSGPETIFDANPGELFVIRNVAALVPVYAPDARSHAASAALEFAVLQLAVDSIVVMGHGRCGGIAVAFDEAAPLTATDFLGSWVGSLRDLAGELGPSDTGSPGDPALGRRELELRSVEQSIVNLRTFPWIRSREQAGTLSLAGCWFDIGLGELHAMGPAGWATVPEA